MVNLSSLSFLRNLRTDNKQFAVIGLGRFGRAVSSTLHSLGYEVLAIDNNETSVNQALKEQISSHAIQLDTTDPIALEEAGLSDFDVVIVAIGNYLAQSIITTLNLKELGVKHVVAKASSEIHMKLLNKVGADHVVFPEREMGCELARSLTKPRLLDQFELDPNHSIVEMLVPAQFNGKTIAELELRNRFGINVLAVGSDEKFEINPPPNKRMEKGTMMVVIGANKDIDRIPL
ncbi:MULTISPECIES: potassium channel family protein [Planktothricoides]|uniref:TrkA family potassium uptake protein n=2 Tax=Planktothricoides raciborskii TaxID=132608 RepID=A0AAU8JHA8_9CYAN|nr:MULTISPECIES: TrkA family potassium uptake protein [Planktothricoides]KOR35178.1 potassium transporter [Planktothricoides sp. SR001]MBD2546174.1 TrkA family potassium uptake protein [Planktothricoides raciborskii FACHB-1370]MBD2583828.1 TrkA family potassium uptake protein [Planktothricoides raciborskii FACHB-1261]